MTYGQKSVFFVAALLVGVTGLGLWLISQRPERVAPTERPTVSHPAKSASIQVQKPSPPEMGFVGSEVCGQCHRSIADTYRTHPMSRSMTATKEVLASANELSDHLVEPPGPRKYRVRVDGDRVWHHEFLPDANGQLIYDQPVEVTFALGSGSQGRAYLLEHDGRFFASSLNWYARTQQWGLAPGYSPKEHRRFEREVGGGCLICHAGRMNELPNQPNVYASPAFLEHSIGCERCHGPGQRHLDFHSAKNKPRSPGDSVEIDPIVNPVKLGVAQREDVCNQCHLQGQAQHLRYGRQVSDFRPGMRLEDVWMIFVSREHDSSDKATQAVSQVEQMRSSACFSRSDGRFGCLTCHDAHSIPAPADRAEFYRQRCLSCHSEAKSECRLPESERLQSAEANSCIACHMPKLGTSDVPHTAQTDHRVLRKRKTNSSVHSQHSGSNELVFLDDADQRIPEWEKHRARGLMLAGRAEKSRERRLAIEAEKLLEVTHRLAPDDVEVTEYLGVAKLLLGNLSEAQSLWVSGLTVAPRHESLLVRLAFFSHDMKDLNSAAAYFDRLFEVNTSHAAFHGRQAHILGQLGDFDRAIEEANRAIELDPTLSQAHEWLAQVHKIRRQDDLSKHHQEISRKLRQAGF